MMESETYLPGNEHGFGPMEANRKIVAKQVDY